MPDENARFSKLEALSAVRDDRTLDPKERLVLVMLVAHADAQGRCYPSLERLAMATGLARRSVAAALAALRARGKGSPLALETRARGKPPKGGGRPPNLYTLRVRFSAAPAPNNTPGLVQPLHETPPSESGEFSANGEGVQCKIEPEFSAPAALEAGQGSCTKKLVTPPRSRKPRAARTTAKLNASTDPRVRQLWDHWHAEQVRLRGCKPVFAASQQGRAGKSFKDILEATANLDQAKAAVTLALSKGYHVQPWQILSALNQYLGGSQPNGRRVGVQRGVIDEAEADRWGKGEEAQKMLGGAQ